MPISLGEGEMSPVHLLSAAVLCPRQAGL